jgi:hypothetical protein
LKSPGEEADKQRVRGQGPVASAEGESGKCEPLVRDYFERYMKDYTAPATMWESLKLLFLAYAIVGVLEVNPEQQERLIKWLVSRF